MTTTGHLPGVQYAEVVRGGSPPHLYRAAGVSRLGLAEYQLRAAKAVRLIHRRLLAYSAQSHHGGDGRPFHGCLPCGFWEIAEYEHRRTALVSGLGPGRGLDEPRQAREERTEWHDERTGKADTELRGSWLPLYLCYIHDQAAAKHRML